MKTLITGIDTLEIGYCIDKYISYPEMFDEIEQAKVRAQNREIDGGFTVFGMDYMVKPYGTGRYDLVLVNDKMNLLICKNPLGGKYFPEIRNSFRSEHLWNGYWYDTIKSYEDWLSQWAVISGSKISRCDLTTDINAALPEFDNQYTGLITRAKIKDDFLIGGHTRGRRNTGYTFGKGSILCRIYPKDYEAKSKHKEYFYSIWEAKGWDGKSPITRIEFQSRRDFLKKWSVNTIDDIRNQAPDLWKYLTESWISIRVPGQDVKHHASRWQKTELWNEVINSGKNFGELSGVIPLSPGIPKVEHLLKMIRGCASQAEAVSGKNMKLELIDMFNSPDYKEEVKKKEYKLGRYR